MCTKSWVATQDPSTTKSTMGFNYPPHFENMMITCNKAVRIRRLHVGDIYEIAPIKGGVAKKINVKDAFECVEITETHVVLRYLIQEEVIQRLGEERTDVIAVNLVQQLLKIVTKDQAVNMIQHYG